MDDGCHDNRRDAMFQHEFVECATARHGRTYVQVRVCFVVISLEWPAAELVTHAGARALIDGGGGASFAPGTGYDGGCAQGVFSVGLQGVSEGEVSEGLGKIDRVLRVLCSCRAACG